MNFEFWRKNAEYVLLFIFFLTVLFFFSKYAFDHKILHDVPINYNAQDTIFHLAMSQELYDRGNLNYLPQYMVGGYEKVVLGNPMLVYNLAVSSSYFSSIEVYDSLMLLNLVFLIIPIFVMYLIIKKFSYKAAVLSLPVAAALFFMPFRIVHTWGQFNFIFGVVFLLAGVWVLFNFDIKYAFVILSLFMTGMALAHPSELVIFIGFVFVFLLFKFLIKDDVRSPAFRILYAFFIMFFLSLNYLLLFSVGFLKSQIPRSFAPVYDAGVRLATMRSFNLFFIIFIFFGIAVSLYYIRMSLKEKNNIYYLFPIYLLLLSYTNLIGQHRAIQLRLMWPVFFMFFFGFGLYNLLKIVEHRKPKVLNLGSEKRTFLSHLFSLLLFVSIFMINYGHFAFNDSYALDKSTWEAVRFIENSTNPNDSILFINDDILNRGTALFLTKRPAFVITAASVLPNGTLSFGVYRKVFSDTTVKYRESFFSFGLYLNGENSLRATTEKTICDFDYFVMYKGSETFGLHTIKRQIYKNMANSTGLSKFFENEDVVIAKNNILGGDCFGH